MKSLIAENNEGAGCVEQMIHQKWFGIIRLRTLVLSFVIPFVLCVPLRVLSAETDFDDLNYSKGTFFGGSTNDSYLLHVAVDKEGNVYGTGFGRDIPATAGAYQTTNHGLHDVVVFKMDPTLTRLIWATYIGGSSIDGAGSIAVNDSGEVFLSGYTYSTDFPVSVSSDLSYTAGSYPSYFALKLSSNGSQLLYSRILGRAAPITQQTQSASKGAQLAIDPAGFSYVLASTTQSTYTITADAVQPSMASSRDLVITKLDPQGNIEYSSFLGGNGDDFAGEIIFVQGMLYCTGATSSTDMPGAGSKTPNGQDAFVMRISPIPVLTPLATVFIGGSGTEQGIALCFDQHASRICMTGFTASNDFASTAAFLSGAKTGGFVAAFDRTLNNQYFASIIAPTVTPTSVITRRTNSGIFISGYAQGQAPVTFNAYQSTLKGAQDGVLFSIDSAGGLLRYGTYIGGSRQDYSTAKVLLFEKECALRIIFGITTHSQDFPTTRDSYQPDKLNGEDDQPALVLFSQLQVEPEVKVLTKVCSGDVRFSLKVPCPPNGIYWNFGDGAETVGDGPQTHHYTHNGTFTTTITLIYPEPDTMVLKRIVVVTDVPDSVRTQRTYYPCVKDTNMHLFAYNCVRYEWSPGAGLNDSTLPNPLVKKPRNGKYVVHGWDARGCESFDTVQVYLLDFKARVEKDTVICRGASVKLQAFGGYSYQWYPPKGLDRTNKAQVLAAPTETTTYNVVVTDGSCPDTAHVTVRVEQPRVLRFRDAPVICPGGFAQLHVEVEGDTAGLSYEWSPTLDLDNPRIASPTVYPTKNTTYTVKVSTALGCIRRDSVKVSLANHVIAKVRPDTSVCLGSALFLDASGGSVYRWEPAIDLDNPASPRPRCIPSADREYKVYVMSGECIDSQQVKITVHSIPQIKASGTQRCCAGDRIELRVVSPDPTMSYSWFPAGAFEHPHDTLVSVQPQSDTTYYVEVRSPQGCTMLDSIRVRVDSTLLVQAFGDTSFCIGGMATLRCVANATDVRWQPSNVVYDSARKHYLVQPQQSTRYIVQAQRGSCIGWDTVDIQVNEFPNLSLQSSGKPCVNEGTELSVSEAEDGVEYQWQPKALLEQSTGPVVRTKALTDSSRFQCLARKNGCTTVESIVVKLHTPPAVVLSADTSVCLGQYAFPRVQTAGLRSLQWSPADGMDNSQSATPRVLAQTEQEYTARVVDSNGCVASATWRLSLRPSHHLHLWCNSIDEQIGTSSSIVVKARADQELQSSLQFIISADAESFLAQSFSPSTGLIQKRKAGKRNEWIVRVPSAGLSLQDQEVFRIDGLLCAAGREATDILIDSIEVNWTECADYSKSPGTLALQGCATNLHRIQYLNRVNALIAPQPVEGELQILFDAEQSTECKIEVLSLLGEVLVTQHVQTPVGTSTLRLNMGGFAAGTYTVRLWTGQKSRDLPFVKI